MTTKTYSASCHCGAVRFAADLDLSKGTNRCNCSICSKARAWFVLTPAANVHMLSGEDTLSDYQWAPPGRGAHLHYRFCTKCGVRAFAQGEMEAMGGPFYAIHVPTLEKVDPDELAASIKYLDGRNDHYDHTPEDTRLM